MPILSGSQFKAMKGSSTVSPAATSANRDIAPSVDKPGFLERLTAAGRETFGDIKETVSGIKGSIEQRSDTFNEGLQSGQSPLRTAVQLGGQALGGVADIAGELTKGAVKTVLPEETEQEVREGMTTVAEPVAAVIKPLVDKYEALKQSDPALARDIDAALGVGEFAATLFSGGLGSRAGGAAVEGVQAVKTAAGEAAEGVSRSIDSIAAGATPVREALGVAVDSAARIPGRIATNVGEKAATRTAIKSLPTPAAQKAAQNGVEISDVNTLIRVVPANKEVASKLSKVVQGVADGTSKADPRAIVGKPIVTRLQKVEADANKVGARLTEEAKKIGVLDAPELQSAVFGQLTKVPGLEGIKVKDGKLIFRDTTIAGNAAAQKRLQSYYSRATQWGKGSNKHLLRQEIFEDLGGKKKGKVELTSTEAGGFEAIRKGLSNALDAKSPGYKALNQRYAKAIKPLNDIKKLLKVEDADLQEIAAGILAQRLGGNSQATTQLQALLRKLDQATQVKGKASLKVEELLDLYNVLARYYDISPANGFKGGIESALRSTGVRDAITNAVVDVAGETPAVRRKALEELMGSLLSTN